MATGISVIKEDYVQYSVSKTCEGQLGEFMWISVKVKNNKELSSFKKYLYSN